VEDIAVGLIAILVGAVFCFRGYLAMRIIIPIWGAYIGFLLGAGLVSGDDFLGTTASWVVGFAVALVFGLLAYLYYVVAVVLGMSAIGFVLGTSLMVALGVTWSWLVVLVGIAAAVALALVAVLGDMPMVILTVLTALAGASTIVTGTMLVGGVLAVSDLGSGSTTEALDDDWWWYAVYAALVVAGIVAQVRDTERQRATLRDNWSSAPVTGGTATAR
jgi:hypothetical protein